MAKRFLSSLLCVVLLVVTVIPVFAAGVPEASGASNAYTYASQNIDSEYTYDGELGALYTDTGTTFRVWAPLATQVRLNRYATGSDNEAGARSLGTVTMQKLMNGSKFTGVWTTTVSGDISNTYYTYSITTPDVRGQDSRTCETQDPYSKAVGVNGDRSMVVDLDATDPEGWENDRIIPPTNPTDAFVWEIHVKDFSYDPDSGVSEKNRGKYLAFTELGTTLRKEGNVSTCIDYLKKLGVTTVQINPLADFASVDETGPDTQFNWGYDPKNYNVPEGSYSSDPYHGAVRITECKQMIQALHNAGISVVMDVVYNHTYEGDSCLNKTLPKYFYRMNDDGTFSNGSGCGNETASERAMFRKYMIDSLVYWTKEYHMDGFRFDLMALHDIETLNLIRAKLDTIDSRIMLWGEGWTGGDSTFPDTTCTGSTFRSAKLWDNYGLDQRVGFFNDGMRNSLKGDTGSIYSKGWLQGESSEATISALAQGICGQKGVNLAYPTQTVTYDACHDNGTLWDQLCASQGLDKSFYDRNEMIIAQNKMAGAILNLSKGTTFILAGEEMGRTKGGNHNSYNAPPDLNMIDWSLAEENADLVNYYTGMRNIRDHFSMFKDPVSQEGYNFISTGPIMASLCTNNTAGEWNKLLFIANSTSTTCNFEVKAPYEQNWVIIADGERAGITKLYEVNNGMISVPPRTVVTAVDSTSYYNVNATDDYGSVKVRFVDSSTGGLIRETSITGKIGSKFTAYAPKAYGFNYFLDGFDGASSGVFTSSEQTVTAKYIYIKESTLKVNYVDTDTGTMLKSSDEYKGKVGDIIKLGIPGEFVGYALDTSKPMPDSVELPFGSTEVTYYYKKTNRTVKINIKHNGSATWAPVLWVWGNLSGGGDGTNYCSSTDWPGDTLTDTNGDGWYDKSFTVAANDESYNIIVSTGSGQQTVDYRGYTQNELWIVIDDSRVWNYTNNLTIYAENPLASSNARIAGTYGPIDYTRESTEPQLYAISAEPYITATVCGVPAEKTVGGAEVELTLNPSSFPSGKKFNGYKINGGDIKIDREELSTSIFTMPNAAVTVSGDLTDKEDVKLDLSAVDSLTVTEELANDLTRLSCYSYSSHTLDFNSDGKGDVEVSFGSGQATLKKLPGADLLDNNYSYTIGEGDTTGSYRSVAFNMVGDLLEVTLLPGDASGIPQTASVRPGKSYVIPECTFDAPTDKDFGGWQYGSEILSPGDTITVTSDITLTAVWNDLFIIYFDANGGSGKMESYKAETNFDVVLPECEYTAPENAVFDKWIIDGEEYFPGEVITLSKSVFATAKWNFFTHTDPVAPTCTKDGNIGYYTDDYGNIFTSLDGTPIADINGDGIADVKDTVLKATGHSYGEPEWNWTGEGSANAVFTCSNDESHTETVEAAVTMRIIEATATQPESKVFTASVTFEGKEYTDEKIVEAVSDSDTETDTSGDNTDTSSEDNSDTSGENDSESDTSGSDNTDTSSDDNSDTSGENDSESDTSGGDNTDTSSDDNSDTSGENNTDTSGDNTDTSSDDTDTSSDDTDTSSDDTDTSNDDTDTSSDDTDTDPDTDIPGNDYVGLLGDIDGDGMATAADALLILRISVLLDECSDDIRLLADINGDGEIMASDALDILRYSTGMSDSFTILSGVYRNKS